MGQIRGQDMWRAPVLVCAAAHGRGHEGHKGDSDGGRRQALLGPAAPL